MKRLLNPGAELPLTREAFNLFSEAGEDPLRVMRERDARLAAEAEAAEYQSKMQRVFADCPGFIGGDAPNCAAAIGRVVVEPGRTVEALAWLKRRFHVNQSLELDRTIEGVAFEVKARVRAKLSGGRRIKVSFAPAEQFTLNFGSDNNEQKLATGQDELCSPGNCPPQSPVAF